jgi:outer membrane protein
VSVTALMIAGFLQAQDLNVLPPSRPEGDAAETAPPVASPPKKESRWFLRAGILEALYNSHATIAVDGKVIPGGTARVTNNTTVNFDIGYDLSDDVAVMLMGGIPPRPSIVAGGTVASLGKLGAVDFGPVILTGVYRLPEKHRIRPYVGTGIAHVFVLKNHDATVTSLKVHDHWAFALQAGVEFRLNRSWGLFADYKRLWLYLNAEGLLATAPVRARETLDPDLVSAGVKFHFR